MFDRLLKDFWGQYEQYEQGPSFLDALRADMLGLELIPEAPHRSRNQKETRALSPQQSAARFFKTHDAKDIETPKDAFIKRIRNSLEERAFSRAVNVINKQIGLVRSPTGHIHPNDAQILWEMIVLTRKTVVAHAKRHCSTLDLDLFKKGSIFSALAQVEDRLLAAKPSTSTYGTFKLT